MMLFKTKLNRALMVLQQVEQVHRVTVEPIVPDVTLGSTTFCQGGSVDLTASGGSTFSWSPGGSRNTVLTDTTSGTYAVVVTDGNNCSGSTSVSVLVHPLPSASINASGPVAFCDGGSVELTASGGGSYSWLPGGETSSTITATTSGTFTVIVTDGNNCSSSSTATITVHPLPSVTLDPFADVCDTLAPFILSGGNPAGGVYSVDGSSGSVFDPELAGIGPHAISYSYTDLNSCTASAGQSIEVISCVASALSVAATSSVVALSVSDGFIYIQAEADSYPYRLSIMDMSGRILSLQNVQEKGDGIDTRSLSAGINLISLESRQGNQQVKRFTIGR